VPSGPGWGGGEAGAGGGAGAAVGRGGPGPPHRADRGHGRRRAGHDDPGPQRDPQHQPALGAPTVRALEAAAELAQRGAGDLPLERGAGAGPRAAIRSAVGRRALCLVLRGYVAGHINAVQVSRWRGSLALAGPLPLIGSLTNVPTSTSIVPISPRSQGARRHFVTSSEANPVSRRKKAPKRFPFSGARARASDRTS